VAVHGHISTISRFEVQGDDHDLRLAKAGQGWLKRTPNFLLIRTSILIEDGFAMLGFFCPSLPELTAFRIDCLGAPP
jgi:hypothetical protein